MLTRLNVLCFCVVAFLQTCSLTSLAEDESMLAATPPMGWNSWNAFEKDIDEKKIRQIADAMVTSGMRDAGYEYLVIDDAWMAPQRDGKGRLVGDPKRFPSGMKAMGDYIHSKGLKFGIYQDRADLTCQGLPGSLDHEQIDMATFAEWGVDYIKLDSCHAERNGRMSFDDYAIFRKAIKSTGRPMVLSISDFGNAAWAWGGKKHAQLWRTSNDIYPWMDSIYYCAQTSGGDQKSHPAFNGLWQFAGPGHWNDPDMLHVGNLKHIPDDRIEIGNRAHFGLWCILAAPLMAGNDLRSMSDSVKSVLTAPELIAVNQDPRGVQGYKIYSKDGREVYCKPLADGTAALLFLNKRREKADISISWKTIGLSGKQPVRDLWARRDLGAFDSGFTAKDLGWHESLMIKVGKKGQPLPTADPIPLEKYTVTREGVTYLSDLYYIWKAHHAPVYDATFAKQPIVIDKKTVTKGIGCKGESAFMFMTNGKAKRFQARVQMDPSSPDGSEGRFKVYNGDFFSNKVLWDSKKMSRDAAALDIDIDISDVQCLMLVFEGKDAFGNWADARVIGQSHNTALPAKPKSATEKSTLTGIRAPEGRPPNSHGQPVGVRISNNPNSQRPILQVINGSRQNLEIFWLKSDDERISNGHVKPGKDAFITTTIGHRFAIVGEKDGIEITATSTVPVQAVRFDPPDKNGVPAFYTQRVSANGFPIVASKKVNPYALKEAAYLVDLMLAKRPDVRDAMIKSGARLCILARNEFTTDQPEWATLAKRPVRGFPNISPRDYRDARARGMGGSTTDPFCSCAEENLLGYPGDPYAAECILIHELAHNIHLRGMVNVDQTFDTRLKATYEAAMAAGLWKGKYASVNRHEYFAEGVQSWFDNNRENDHDHNHVNTRDELMKYDPRLAEICREVFGDTKLRYTKPATRLNGHLSGYDPAKAPRFEWPERLNKAQEAIRRSVQQRIKKAEK